MIYVIGFRQDIVVSFVDHALRQNAVSNSEIRTIYLENICGVQLNFNSLEIESIQLADEKLAIKPHDRIYLRPYSFEAAGRCKILNEELLKSLQDIYRQLLLGRQIKLGNTSLRSDSNNNKWVHSLIFDDLIRTPTWRGGNVGLDEVRETGYIVKSPSHVRTQVVTSTEFGHRLNGFAIPPTLVQKQIIGVPVRVTVIGFKEVVAAATIGHGGTDYRYDGEVTFQRMQLSSHIREKVLAIAKRYGLPLCGMDLIRAYSGEWCFLEVNPEPGWSFLSEEDNLEILRYIIEFLKKTELKETLGPDERLSQPMAFHAQVSALDGEYVSYPKDLQPSDFIAKPGEEHPMWGAT